MQDTSECIVQQQEGETCAQLFTRLSTKPSLQYLDPILFPVHFPEPGEVIEIHGSNTTGKTELLMHFVSKCILPKQWNGISIDGIEAEVFFIDTDFQLSIIRLHQLLKEQLRIKIQAFEKHLCSQLGEKDFSDKQHQPMKNVQANILPSSNTNMNYNNEEIGTDAIENKSCHLSTDALDDVVKSCLNRFYLVRCTSTEQLLITLHSMEAMFCNHPKMCVLMLDSVSSFYWIDRVKTGDNWKSFTLLQEKVVSVLKQILMDYHLVLFLTKGLITQSTVNRKTFNMMEHRQQDEFSGKAWCKLSNHRLILTKEDFPFPVVIKGHERSAAYWVKVHRRKDHRHYRFYITDSGISYV